MPVNLKHETFIREMIAHGDRRRAYLAAYPTSAPASAYNNACRLLAKPDISGRIQEAVGKVEEKVSAELMETYRDELMSMFEKRKELAAIVRGEKLFEMRPIVRVTARRPGGQQKSTSQFSLYREANVWEILSAITLDAKLEAAMTRHS